MLLTLALATAIEVAHFKPSNAHTTPELSRELVVIPVKSNERELSIPTQGHNQEDRILGISPDSWVAFFTAALFLSTLLMWLETRRLARGADDQAEKMARSIRESARAATAMESVADSMASNTKSVIESVATSREIATRQRQLGSMQMRAYVNVLIGGALYQDREKRKKFEADPLLVNTGPTPASRVRWRGRAAILPVPLPKDYKFTLPAERAGSSLLAPHQNANMAFVVDDYIRDADVDSVKRGENEGLYVWGVVSYSDVFRRIHRTVFCQQVYWQGTGEVALIRGWHLDRHNKAN